MTSLIERLNAEADYDDPQNPTLSRPGVWEHGPRHEEGRKSRGYALLERDSKELIERALARQTLTVGCMLCQWSCTGIASEVLEAQTAHLAEHGRKRRPILEIQREKVSSMSLEKTRVRAERIYHKTDPEELRRRKLERDRARKGSKYAATHCCNERCGKPLPDDRKMQVKYCNKSCAREQASRNTWRAVKAERERTGWRDGRLRAQ